MTEEDKRTDLQGKFIPSLSGGLNLFDSKNDIKDSELTDMSNMVMVDGQLCVDTGFDEYASGGVVSGARRRMYRFRLKNGTEQKLLFTQTGLYYQLPGAPTTWVAAGDFAGGTFWCTGSAKKPISVVTWQAEDIVIWSNGVDTVFQYLWDAGNSVWAVKVLGGLAGAGDDPTVDTCQALAIWEDRLLLFNTTESSVVRPNYIRWSDEADPEEFDVLNGLVDAGFQALYEDGGAIRHAEALGQYLIIYRDSSIVRASWIGSDETTIDFQTMIPNEGILGYRSVAVASDAHYVVTQRGVFKYTAGVSLEPIGHKIDKLILGPNASVDLSEPDYMYGHFMHVEKTCWFSFPTSASGTLILVYDILRKTWHKREITGLSTSMNSAWIHTTNYYHMMITQAAAVMDYNHSSVTDFVGGADTQIAWYFVTKNLNADRFIRTDFVELDALGTGTVTVTISKDDGKTFTAFGTFSLPEALSTELILYKVDKQIVSKNLIFKVSGTGGSVKFGSFKVAFYDESEF